jgi:hypothetical protein
MISFLTSAKSFDGPARQIQLKAIRSWMRLHSDVEVFLYGSSAGAEQVCHDLRITYIPEIESSPGGPPYLNAILSHAEIHAKHDLQMYVNCDIIFCSPLVELLTTLNMPEFLIVGQRINLSSDVAIDIGDNDPASQVISLASCGKVALEGPGAMDYFVFQRGTLGDVGPLIIGRFGYDSALVATCLKKGIPIIDATLSIIALHQDHGYDHVQGGRDGILYRREGEQNKRLHGILHSAPNTADAHFMLVGKKLIPICCRSDSLRRLELYFRFTLGITPAWLLLRAFWRFLVATGIYSPPRIEMDDMLNVFLGLGKNENSLNPRWIKDNILFTYRKSKARR